MNTNKTESLYYWPHSWRKGTTLSHVNGTDDNTSNGTLNYPKVGGYSQHHDPITSLRLARGCMARALFVIACVCFVVSFIYFVKRRKRYYRKECYCCCRFTIEYFANPFFQLAFLSFLCLLTDSLPYVVVGCVIVAIFTVWFETAVTIILAIVSVYIPIYYLPFSGRHSLPTGSSRAVDAPMDDRMPYASRLYWVKTVLSNLIFFAAIIVCEVLAHPLRIIYSFDEFMDGPWCWREKSRVNGFYYYLEWAFMASCVLVCLPTSIFLCLITTDRYTNRRLLPSIRLKKTIFLPYLMFCFSIIVRIIISAVDFRCIATIIHCNKSFSYTDAIGKPLSKLSIIIASLLFLSVDFQAHGQRNSGERQGLLSQRL